MYNIPSSVSSQSYSYYFTYAILTPQQEPLTIPAMEEINIHLLVLGLTRPGIWNRYFKYMYAKFMLNEIGVYSVSWLDVSFANKENK
jgi:hypothetical protein